MLPSRGPGRRRRSRPRIFVDMYVWHSALHIASEEEDKSRNSNLSVGRAVEGLYTLRNGEGGEHEAREAKQERPSKRGRAGARALPELSG
jgi:hypothetical protein